jgi:hypothetical protein
MASRTFAVGFIAVALAGCGASDERRTPPPPTLPPKVAEQLAKQSDKVASALAAGDSCGALSEAEKLRQETIAAINKRRVPAAFLEPLTGTVNELAARIVCIRVEVGEPKDEDEGKGRGKGKGKGKDKGKGDD